MTNIIKHIDEAIWDQFVKQHPRGNIFQSPAMYHLYASTPGYTPGVIIIEDNGNMQGVMVYNIIHEKGIKSLFSKRSIITGGPVVKNNEPDLVQKILVEYNRRIGETNTIYTQFRNLWDTGQWNEIFSGFNFFNTKHCTVLIDLTKDENQLIAEMHKKRYKNIKRAMKKNIFIQSTEDKKCIEEIFTLIKKTYERIKLPCPPENIFLNAKEKLLRKVKFFAAWHNNKIIAARVYLLFKDTVYDWYAASDLSFSNLHPNDLLPWEFMLWAKKNNYKIYDFAGAGNPERPYGVRDYKMRFGGSLEDFGRYQCIHKPFMYRLGKAGIRINKLIS
jgi:serine/alanine adding enzyme